MKSAPLNIIFAGTPDFAARCLSSLLTSPHRIVAVYTQPDRPAGRRRQLQASAVKTLAIKAQIPVYQPDSLVLAEEQIKSLQADMMIVVAYGLILPINIINATSASIYPPTVFKLPIPSKSSRNVGCRLVHRLTVLICLSQF